MFSNSFSVMCDKNEVVFIGDKFTVLALAFPLVWLLWHRLYVQSALYFALMGLSAAFSFYNMGSVWFAFPVLVKFLASLLVALEGSQWQKSDLEKKGYGMVDLIFARSNSQAEEIYASRMAHENKPIQRANSVSISLIPVIGSI
jgi:hypothetical protein